MDGELILDGPQNLFFPRMLQTCRTEMTCEEIDEYTLALSACTQILRTVALLQSFFPLFYVVVWSL